MTVSTSDIMPVEKGSLVTNKELQVEGICEEKQLKRTSSSNLAESDQHSSMNSVKVENQERGNWMGRLDFILSCISYAVGLGNIWRFPYLCYRNGGAVFLIPYLTFLILCGMPLFFLEVSYGQFASLSPITVWKISPLFKGIGWGMVLISGIVCIYYNIIITWTLYYLFRSFTSHLPWTDCNNAWNTPACVYHTGRDNETGEMVFYDSTGGIVNNSYLDTTMGTNGTTPGMMKRTTPSEEFWERHVLDISPGIEEMGGIRWELFGCLALAWVAVFLCLCKGVKSSGKVAYFTATFPYMVLIILLVRGVTLPGAMDGIKFYLIPQWHKLLDMRVWGEAAMQIFYSIGAAWGALITMASYNRFHNDCYRDARIVPVMNCATSIFAGFVIFSIIGFMAHETGETIDNVVQKGPGLVFVVYPAAVARMPLSPLWSILFFSMLFSVGIGSQFGMFETMTSAFTDEFPHLLKGKKTLLCAALCFLEFLLGIPCIMNGGIYVLQIMDWYSSTFSLMVLSFTECVIISWVYGIDRFYLDIELMIGYKPCLWWKACWKFITPALIVFVLIFTIIIHTPVTYADYIYPGWAIGLGWVFALFSMAPLPIMMLLKLYQAEGTLWERIKKQIHHSDDFGPALDEHRELYLASLDRQAVFKNSSNSSIEVVKPLNGKPENKC